MSDTDPTSIDIRLAAEFTVIRPGDTVLVRVPATLNQQQAHVLKERLGECLPDVTVHLVGGIDGIDVYRPTPEPTTQCWHTEPGSPCDWDVCRQPERLTVGDGGTDPATPR
ncbi:hypothetical protein [Streptomyces sp. NBC_00035]|uniref:hypothetical protein n=1 Tax=Streptomyces sp. NBC_00035 TaxID=2903614 RepID=UPI00324C5975